MSIVTGKNLLQAVIDTQDVRLLPAQKTDMENVLQNLIDTGQGTAFALADMMRVTPQIRSSIDEGESFALIVHTVSQKITALIPVEVDTETFPDPLVLDAGDGVYEFLDDAAVGSHVIIDNFSSDDVLTPINAGPSDYSFANDGADVILSYNFNDEGVANILQLTGVVSSGDLVYDLESFTDVTGFDLFVV